MPLLFAIDALAHAAHDRFLEAPRGVRGVAGNRIEHRAVIEHELVPVQAAAHDRRKHQQHAEERQRRPLPASRELDHVSTCARIHAARMRVNRLDCRVN
jgi:hypothetical protein